MKPKASKPKKAARKAKKPKHVTRKSQTGKKWQVWKGTRMFTSGGLTKKDLMVNKRGKVISKKNGARKLPAWMTAVAKARKELGITGFVIMNRGAQGVALYKLAK